MRTSASVCMTLLTLWPYAMTATLRYILSRGDAAKMQRSDETKSR